MDKGAQDELADLAARALSRHHGAEAFLKRCGELMGAEYHRLVQKIFEEEVEKAGIPFLFNGTLRGFANSVLDREYRQTLTRRELRALDSGRNYKDLNALEWAIDSRRSFAARFELERLFGPGYRNMLRGLRRDKIVTEITREQLSHFDNMMKLGVTDYAKLSKENRLFGHLYEADHLFEQRFWTVADVDSALNVLDDSFAVIVPKNPHVAFLMNARTPGSPSPIGYVHSE